MLYIPTHPNIFSILSTNFEYINAVEMFLIYHHRLIDILPIHFQTRFFFTKKI